jgi:hypothetical protein
MENNQSESYLTKQLAKLLCRLERILIPNDSMRATDVGLKFSSLLSRIKLGEFFENYENKSETFLLGRKRPLDKSKNDTSSIPRYVNWILLESSLKKIIMEDLNTDIIPSNIIDEIESEKYVQMEVNSKSSIKMKIQNLQV